MSKVHTVGIDFGFKAPALPTGLPWPKKSLAQRLREVARMANASPDELRKLQEKVSLLGLCDGE